MTDISGRGPDIRSAFDLDLELFLETCARLPPRTRRAIGYLIEQAIALERRGEEAQAITLLETLTLRLMRSRLRPVDWH